MSKTCTKCKKKIEHGLESTGLCKKCTAEMNALFEGVFRQVFQEDRRNKPSFETTFRLSRKLLDKGGVFMLDLSKLGGSSEVAVKVPPKTSADATLRLLGAETSSGPADIYIKFEVNNSVRLWAIGGLLMGLGIFWLGAWMGPSLAWIGTGVTATLVCLWTLVTGKALFAEGPDRFSLTDALVLIFSLLFSFGVYALMRTGESLF